MNNKELCISDKKIVVMYGNCHIGSLTEVLNQCKEFTDKYEIYPVELICNIKDKEYFELPIFRTCDVFIHQSIRKNNRYGEEFASENLIKRLPEHCKIISVPNVYHMPMCFYPQYIEKPEFKRKGATIFFRDSIVEKMYLDNKSVDEIIETYKDVGLFDTERLQELWCDFIEKVKRRESEWDVKIADYIIEHVGDKPLFYDPNHPREEIIRYIAERVLELLEVDVDGDSVKNVKVKRMTTYEMPICKSVSEYFGFPYDLNDEIRIGGNKLVNIHMYLRDYIKQYIAMMWQDSDLPSFIRLKSLIRYVGMRIVRVVKRIKEKIL